MRLIALEGLGKERVANKLRFDEPSRLVQLLFTSEPSSLLENTSVFLDVSTLSVNFVACA